MSKVLFFHKYYTAVVYVMRNYVIQERYFVAVIIPPLYVNQCLLYKQAI